MKKLILTGFAFMSIMTAKAQWTYETIDNSFDEPYKIAYTQPDNYVYLKLELVRGEVVLYISGGYYCDEKPSVDVVFVVDGVNKKYNFTAYKSENSKTLYFTFNFLAETSVEDFKNAKSVKIRVNESYCSSEQYVFDMGHSKAALEFISKP
jgi:hypothetical protein